jgi:hypothetical protein
LQDVGGRVVAFITLGELLVDKLSAGELSAGELPLYRWLAIEFKISMIAS